MKAPRLRLGLVLLLASPAYTEPATVPLAAEIVPPRPPAAAELAKAAERRGKAKGVLDEGIPLETGLWSASGAVVGSAAGPAGTVIGAAAGALTGLLIAVFVAPHNGPEPGEAPGRPRTPDYP